MWCRSPRSILSIRRGFEWFVVWTLQTAERIASHRVYGLTYSLESRARWVRVVPAMRPHAPRPLRLMDGSLLFDPQYLPIIVATLVGFSLLAAALLVPIWRFLKREAEVAEKWTPDRVAEQLEIVRKKREAENASEDDEHASSDPASDNSASGDASGSGQTPEQARES